MKTLWQDVRYAIRMLLKNSGFATVAVLTLALGIGVNTALFTFFNFFVLRPLPIKDPERIVNLSGVDQNGERHNLFSYLDYLDYRDRNSSFSDLVAWNQTALAIGDAPPGAASGDEASLAAGYQYAFGAIVSGNYFSVLGGQAALGRTFLPEEDLTPGSHPVVVLSYGFWQRKFAADPNLVGQTIKLHGHPFTVVGIAATEFIGTQPRVPDFWVPLMMRDQVGGYKGWLSDRNVNSVSLIGRLRPGISLEQAQAEMTVIAQQLAQAHPGKNRKNRVTAKPGATFINLDEEFLPVVLPVLTAVGLVLLIACANVANLLLARAASRHKEIAVRLALGASRGRLIRQLLTESVLISVLGGAVGLLLAVWTISLLYPIVLSSMFLPVGYADSFRLDLDPDYRVFGFTLLVSLVAGIASGLAPALQSSRTDLTAALKDEGSTLGQRVSQSKLRSALVVAQIAVCLTLLISAGLLVRSLRKLETIDTGLETKNVFTVAVGLPAQAKNGRREAEFRRQLAERLQASPGVKSVSQVHKQPLTGMPPTTPVMIPGRETPNNRPLRANYNIVSPSYFETLGISLSRGRVFTEEESQTGAPVVIISDTTARRFWPGEDPIGKRIGIGAASTNKESANKEGATPSFSSSAFSSSEVIGVVRDTRSGWVWRADDAYLYLPHHSTPASNTSPMYLAVRTEDDPKTVMTTVRGEAEAIDPNLLVSLREVEDSLSFQMAPFRGIALLASALGLLAMLLAAVGLYGVMAYVVSRRTREIGIRMALGARESDVLKLILAQGLRLIIVGIFLGMCGGAVTSRLLAAALIDLSPLDPVTFGSTSLFLAVVAMLATYIPARRATKVDPMVALRYE
ncbi:MAG: ABC transporter permease [Pyrinomonadaceae bacterium]|nr:ABC transporter permease [Pyrinomonadaceae bacterium]